MQDWEKVARAIAGAKPSTELIQGVEKLGLNLQSSSRPAVKKALWLMNASLCKKS
jgi:hypothetical protein